MAPGGGGSATRLTIPTGWPASPRSSARRGAWSDTSTTRARSPSQCSTPSTRRSVRPGGSTGSRQPNRSPEVRPFDAKAIPAASPASDCQVSSSVRAPWSRAFQSRGGRKACGQSRGSSPCSTSSPWRSSAWRHRKSAASARSPGSSRTNRVAGSRWSRPVDGAMSRDHTSAASPVGSARPAGTAAGRSGEASPANRARSSARRSGNRPASRPRRARIASAPPSGSRNSVAGRSVTSPTGPTDRWSVGSNARSESISSPKNSIRTGSDADGGNTSTIPPRRANSPRPATSSTGVYPRSKSSARSGSRPMRVPGRERPERRGQVVRGERGLEQRLDAGDEHLRRAVPPRRQRRHPRGRLVGHQLRALVRERRPWLQDGDQRRVAQPRAQLLRHAVADLRVAGHPADPLGVRVERERRGEERLRPVRDRRQADVPAVHRRRRDRAEPLAEGPRTSPSRGAAAAAPPGPGRGARHLVRPCRDRRPAPSGRRAPAAAPGRPRRRHRCPAAPPGRAARPPPRRRPGPGRPAARQPPRRRVARPTPGRPGRRRCAGGSCARGTGRSTPAPPTLVRGVSIARVATRATVAAQDPAPARLRPAHAGLVGRPADLAGFGCRGIALAGRRRRLELEAVEPVRGLGRPLPGPRLHRVGGGVQQDRQAQSARRPRTSRGRGPPRRARARRSPPGAARTSPCPARR